jgi:hypothetical protein
LFIVTLLSLFSALGWDVCYIMPDIFSSIAIMLLYLLLFHFPQKWLARIILILAYLLSAQMHFSYMVAHVGIVGLFLLLRLTPLSFLKPVPLSHIVLILLATLGNMGLFRMEKKALGGADSFSNASHIFLMAKMVENGVLKTFGRTMPK